MGYFKRAEFWHRTGAGRPETNQVRCARMNKLKAQPQKCYGCNLCAGVIPPPRRSSEERASSSRVTSYEHLWMLKAHLNRDDNNVAEM